MDVLRLLLPQSDPLSTSSFFRTTVLFFFPAFLFPQLTSPRAEWIYFFLFFFFFPWDFRTMGRRRGSWHLLVPLLLLLGCVFRRDLAQTDDGGKSVYFWETGRDEPDVSLICEDVIWRCRWVTGVKSNRDSRSVCLQNNLNEIKPPDREDDPDNNSL